MNRICKICKEKISIKTIKDEAKGNKHRQRSAWKDYSICIASGYCIKCLRQKKESPTNKELEQKIKTELLKKGVKPIDIERQLPKLKEQWKNKNNAK